MFYHSPISGITLKGRFLSEREGIKRNKINWNGISAGWKRERRKGFLTYNNRETCHVVERVSPVLLIKTSPLDTKISHWSLNLSIPHSSQCLTALNITRLKIKSVRFLPETPYPFTLSEETPVSLSSTIYHEENFGGNQLCEGWINILPLYLTMTTNLQTRFAENLLHFPLVPSWPNIDRTWALGDVFTTSYDTAFFQFSLGFVLVLINR